MAGSHEIPCWKIERREVGRNRKGPWQAILLPAMMTTDDLVCFQDDLRNTPEPGRQYRAVLAPEFGVQEYAL